MTEETDSELRARNLETAAWLMEEIVSHEALSRQFSASEKQEIREARLDIRSFLEWAESTEDTPITGIRAYVWLDHDH